MTNRFLWLHGFLAALPGAESDFKAEWGWTRYKVGGRMFAAVCQNERGEDFLLTLKADPVEAQLQRASFWRVFPGYYCTKHCWNSVYLCDPGADWEEVTSRIRRWICRALRDRQIQSQGCKPKGLQVADGDRF